MLSRAKIKGRNAKGRPKRMWFDDVRQWTMLKDYGEVKRSAEEIQLKYLKGSMVLYAVALRLFRLNQASIVVQTDLSF